MSLHMLQHCYNIIQFYTGGHLGIINNSMHQQDDTRWMSLNNNTRFTYTYC